MIEPVLETATLAKGKEVEAHIPAILISPDDGSLARETHVPNRAGAVETMVDGGIGHVRASQEHIASVTLHGPVVGSQYAVIPELVPQPETVARRR
ncbi:hypothetical protein ZWY2020_024292 [Hordeum vulgare]|nr:hypothetical protein ZWY2020_024292 [Hordeum vulgare]